MAKITKVVVTLNRKVSDGSFGSFGGEITLEAEIEPGDDIKEVKAQLRKSAAKDLGRTIELVTPDDFLPSKKKSKS